MRDRRVDPVELRRRIDALRVERQWPRDQVLAHLGISRSFYYSLRHGTRQPGLLTAHQLAAKLGCEVEDFTIAIEVSEPAGVPQTDDRSSRNPDE